MKELFLSPTRLDAIQKCWRYYQYAQLRKLVPYVKAARMEKGSVGHKILAHYYSQRALQPAEHRDTLIEEAFKHGALELVNTDLKREDANKIFEVCHQYFDHYVNEDWMALMDDKGKPLVEVPLTKLLYQREDTNDVEGIRIIFNGIIDLILAPRKNVPITIVDHKFKDRYSDLDPLSNQLALYAAATGIRDVMRNDIGGQKEGNVNKFLRPNYRYEQSQMDENVQWAVYWALEAEYHELQNIYPPNPTSCDKFGGCLFGRVCNTIPAGREGVINANFRTATKRFSIYSVEETKEVVSPVRGASGAVGDSAQVGNDRELEPVPHVQEGRDAREELRDGTEADGSPAAGERGEARETSVSVSDRLLKQLE